MNNLKTNLGLVATIIIAGVAAFIIFHSRSANAETYINTVPIGCDNPTERTDGTPLDCLGRVEIFISDTVTDLPPPDSFSPKHTEIMQGGCADRTVDASTWDTSKEWYKLGVAYDCDGRVSSYSNFVPFSLDKAPPSAPVVR